MYKYKPRGYVNNASKNIIDCKICKKRVGAGLWGMHIVGKKHLHYTPPKITVTGLYDSDDIDAVHNYFGAFGSVRTKEVTTRNGKVSIEYSFLDKRAHSKIIYKDHTMFNQSIKIHWEEVTTPPPIGYNQNLINNDGSKEIVNKRKTPDRPSRRKPLTKKIDSESTKRAILETIKIAHTFSDQVSILQNNLQSDKDEIEQKRKLIYDDITAALNSLFTFNKIYFFGSSVTGLDVQSSDLDIYIADVRDNRRPEVATLKVIRNLIFKCRKFCDVLLISNAKIPIIKCIHTNTQICCDLNIKNKLSVCNSELIKYYLSLDDKLRPLMILLKYWAECCDLKKVNYFSSYAIYMMVIFYLQHEPYNLPCVRDLQKDVDPDLVEGWNCAFNPKEYSNLALKNESMNDLVAGFFRFYSDFDYISYVICPYLGNGINKTHFLKPYDLPEGFEEYVNVKDGLPVRSGVIIQDPFEHARNVAVSVSYHCMGRFIMACKSSLQLMSGNEHELLHKILTQKAPLDYSFHINKPEDKDESEWTNLIKHVMVKILIQILSMKIVQTRESPLTYNCYGEHNVWDNRVNIYKNLLTQLPADTSEIDKEIAATKCLIKYFPQTLPTDFSVELTFTQDPYRAEFLLKHIDKKSKNILHTAHFLYMRMTKYLNCGQIIDPDENEEEAKSSPILMEVDLFQTDPVRGAKHHSDEMTHENDENDDNTGKKMRVEGGDVQTNEGETSKSDEEKVDEDDDEDIPADFFDDFSNQDFMDGLDIVDAWDDDKFLDTENSKDSERSSGKKHSPIRFISSKSAERRVKKNRSKSLTRRIIKLETYRKRSRSRSRDRVNTERRDPEKTKRDISKDKIKCAKDREQKIVNDKLRIVETGLVPPGTEMDVDLNTIFKEKETKEKKDKVIKERKEKESKERKSSNTGSVEKVREARPERERERRFVRRSGSREIRKPPRRSPTPPPYRPRIREREPLYRPRKRTPSIDSTLSDRELWIRSRKRARNSRSRDRDRDSPRRSKTKKYEEAKKKKSFLEEIRDKLNETRPVNQSPINYGAPYANTAPQPIPAPVPAPAPVQYFTPVPAPNPPQYDQSFFIGDTFRIPQNMVQPQPVCFGNAGNVMQVPQVQIGVHSPMPAPVAFKPKALVSPKINLLSEVKAKPRPEEKKETIEDIDKLFADKKISLSDFLSITAKCEVQSSSPELLQKKIKVISRCQDAIRAMSDDRKFTGRLSVKPSIDQNRPEVKYQSPLRRIPVVRFQFTSPTKPTEDVDSFALALDKLLQKVGVLKEVLDLEESTESLPVLTNSSFADEETASLSLKASMLNSKRFEVKSECEECKKRKAKMFAEVGSQCADNKDSVSISTQVAEEDLVTKPKNESIAYLTPAQLLGKEKEKEPEKVVLLPTPENEKKTQGLLGRPPMQPFLKKDKPKPPIFKTRGGFRKTLRDRPGNNYYEFDNEEFEFYDRRSNFEDPRESFGNRYGGPPARFQRQFGEEGAPPMQRLNQFRENEGNFTDFTQPFRGRGGRMPPRF